MVFDKFFALIRIHFSDMANDISLEDIEENCRVENCKAERMKYVDELLKVSQVTTKIEEFDSRVQKVTDAYNASSRK
jgi:hypothetical protein